MIKSTPLAAALFLGLALGPVSMATAPAPHSPEQVHTALKILASVYADMESKLPNRQFDRLPHENEEFQEGAGAMRDAMANEPADFKSTVEAALDKTRAAAQQVADVSRTHDAAQARAALDALAASMHALNSLFPESLRAEPGSVPAPQHGGSAASH
jgi:hypothetical protein